MWPVEEAESQKLEVKSHLTMYKYREEKEIYMCITRDIKTQVESLSTVQINDLV